ncbi:hypothetical protein Btru_007466 [Bulinus truncatus]|nr:hypothetical protein Btru_007466 [Bulinus truncatus]
MKPQHHTTPHQSIRIAVKCLSFLVSALHSGAKVPCVEFKNRMAIASLEKCREINRNWQRKLDIDSWLLRSGPAGSFPLEQGPAHYFPCTGRVVTVVSLVNFCGPAADDSRTSTGPWTTTLVYLITFCYRFFFLLRHGHAGQIVGPDTISGNQSFKITVRVVCQGTSTGFTNRGDAKFRYEQYIRWYNSCQVIMGNLEIVSLDDHNFDYDLSFLSSIEEVTGYVLLAMNYLEYIPLTSLRIIRGQTLFEYESQFYSLFVTLNFDPQGGYGLRELRFKQLTEIQNGYVYFQDNAHLCYEDTIVWHDINPEAKIPVANAMRAVQTLSDPREAVGGKDQTCVRLSRCFGPNYNQCCNPECAAGCFGTRKEQCFTCKMFKDNVSCESTCQRRNPYDPYHLTVNRTGSRVAYGIYCSDKCPAHLLEESGYCVKECSRGSYAKEGTSKCEPCNGPCPRACEGIDEGFLNLKTLANFAGCTHINGNLRILKPSFEWDPHFNITGIHPNNLTILKDVTEITGYVMIQSNHPEFTNLSFLSNLKTIYGRHVSPGSNKAALSIMLTPLKSLELNSLKSIVNGNVIIIRNPDLCYVQKIEWSRLIGRHTPAIHSNKDPKKCEEEGEVCDPQCGVAGCWGKGPTKCISCKNYAYVNFTSTLCLENCDAIDHLYHKSDGVCDRCHIECESSCTGPLNTQCHKCANVAVLNMDGKISCEASCGDSMYPNQTKHCLPCHPFCKGCTGPGDFLGEGGCSLCHQGRKDSVNSPIYCVTPDESECESNYFKRHHLVHSQTKNIPHYFPMCQGCDPVCDNCTKETADGCVKCKKVKNGGFCANECPPFNYIDAQKECKPCDSECRSKCTGPTASDCMYCSNYKVINSANTSQFTCVPKCPEELGYLVKDFEDNRIIICADTSHPEVQKSLDNSAEEEKKLKIILGCTIPGALLLLFIIIVVTYLCHKRAQNNMKAAEFTAKITGHEEIEPLTPTNAKPDLSKMRIINEEELRKGAIIGSGAFGTVYKGIWIPHGENVKIPVAIKILQEGTSPNQSTELLEEARVMCSVEHICCVRILAVCLKYQMMLVTQLMPHGNLLNYIRINAQNIGSKALLTWCTQIARGMAYLEERGIVHRDLAARNVLVQTPYQVKITDFGLAKLLDNDAEVYHSSGGLMPIKWLALECINHRIFTHKSDVWSFGVTLWELFTLGKKPYESVRTKDVPLLLEKGERLQQPSMCTIDVYMIMVKCWMLEAESRPSFKELVDEFAKMSRDPGRYLVIEGDALMRLPSVSYDKHELVHGMTDGPENIMEAEEYLQPVDPRRLHRPVSLARQHSNLSNASAHFMSDSNSPGSKSLKAQWENQKIRDKKYSHLDAAAKAKQEREPFRGESVNSRYSSDPIRYFKDKDEIEMSFGQDPFPEYAGYSNSQQYSPDNTSLKMPQSILLPVDKDDYLQPGAAAQSLAYLDLDGKGYYQNEKDAHSDDPFDENESMLGNPQPSDQMQNGNKHFYSNFQPKQAQAADNAVANPVYFDSSKKWPKHNGYHAVPNVSTSPVHNRIDSSEYYKPMFGGSPTTPLVDTEVKMSGVRLKNSESKV